MGVVMSTFNLTICKAEADGFITSSRWVYIWSSRPPGLHRRPCLKTKLKEHDRECTPLIVLRIKPTPITTCTGSLGKILTPSLFRKGTALEITLLLPCLLQVGNVFQDMVSYSPYLSGTQCVPEANLELLILLPLPSNSWGVYHLVWSQVIINLSLLLYLGYIYFDFTLAKRQTCYICTVHPGFHYVEMEHLTHKG